jgi:hypothetical protein
MLLRSALLLAAALAMVRPAAAQYGDPAAGRPPRLVLAGEAVGTLSREDDGYFNETDYGHNVLRQLRLRVSARWQPIDRVALLADVRGDAGPDDYEGGFRVAEPVLQALYVRVRPWPRRPFDLQAGRIPPVFGAFARRRYTSDNPVIGYPLAYQYLVALRPDALPVSPLELARNRGRGWLPDLGLGSRSVRGGVPLVSALQWDTGVEARLGERPVQATIALTQGTLASPRVEDDNGGKQVSARIAWSPGPTVIAAVSASRGAWLDDEVVSLAGVSGTAFRQSALGADLEVSRG